MMSRTVVAPKPSSAKTWRAASMIMQRFCTLVCSRLPNSQRLIGNPDTGVVHGGVITGFLDQSCGMAVGSTLKEPRSFATLDLRIDYMKPATPGIDILFEGECIKLTSEIAFARARAFQEKSDDPIAIATATFMFTQQATPGI